MYKMHWYYLNSIYYIRKRVPYCEQQNQAHMVLNCAVCRPTTPKIKRECSISGGRNRGWWISGGSCGGQRKPTNPKTSANARFWCGWGWVIGCGGCGSQWVARESPQQPKTSNECSISGIVGSLLVAARGNTQPPKTGMRARFRGLWGVMVAAAGARESPQPLKTSANACFRGWWGWLVGGQPKEAHHHRRRSIRRWWG